jgi:hypothetical protein
MSSRRQGFARDLLAVVLRSKAVWLAHLVANALLLIAFFYWTRIPDETGWQFTVTVVTGLIIAFVTLWLHSATFIYFSPAAGQSVRTSLRESLPCLAAFLLWAAVFGLVLSGIGTLWNYEEQFGGYAHHLLPLFLRRHIPPRAMFSAVHWLVWALYFFLWPILFLPVGAQVARKGFRGFFTRTAFRPICEVRFWIVYLICFLIGACIPYQLAWMVPTKPSSLTEQTWNMLVRLGVAYLLLVTAWLILGAAIARASGGGEAAKAPESAPLGAIPAS